MKLSKYFLLILLCFIFNSCHEILDKGDLESVDEQQVWNDPLLAEAYINSIYVDNLPGWDRGISDRSDESDGGTSYMYGQLDENSVNHWPYNNIRRINILINDIDDGSLEMEIRERLKGEAYFFRALRYFGLLQHYGGVPLILEPQTITDDLLVERSTTSETMAQIISDLDAAIERLPLMTSASNDNNGRIHRGTALAVKGRFLLHWASPQYNWNDDAGRWQAAYEANLEAKEYLDSQGFGLFSEFGGIWLNEMNEEVIFVRRYSGDPTQGQYHHNWSAATRPLDMSVGASGSNQPTWEMVQAFPMEDGRSIEGHPDYDELYFWQNRDPRFYETIVYNGAPWELSGQNGRIQFTYVGFEVNAPTRSGFYTRKAIDESQDAQEAFNSDTDWIELRYAEVLLNLAEAANAVGETDEAYDLIFAIRERAGIDPGDGFYGLDAGMSQVQMHDALLHERQIEFAFEGKRHWDLRRNMLFEEQLNGTRRHGLRIDLSVSSEEWAEVESTVDLESEYHQYFEHEVIELDTQFDINWQDNYYFYAIPSQHLQLNSRLEQTQGWPGGTFNPLQ